MMAMDSEVRHFSLKILLAQLQNTFKIQMDACFNLGDGDKMGPSHPHRLPSALESICPTLQVVSSKLFPIVDCFLPIKDKYQILGKSQTPLRADWTSVWS